MEAALNVVPSLGLLGGWWVEGVTGRSIGDLAREPADGDGRRTDAESPCDELGSVAIPRDDRQRGRYLDVMATLLCEHHPVLGATGCPQPRAHEPGRSRTG